MREQDAYLPRLHKKAPDPFHLARGYLLDPRGLFIHSILLLFITSLFSMLHTVFFKYKTYTSPSGRLDPSLGML